MHGKNEKYVYAEKCNFKILENISGCRKTNNVAAANIEGIDLKKRNCEDVRKSPQVKDRHGFEPYSHIKCGETLITSRRFLLHGIRT